MSTISETRQSYDEYLRQFMIALYNQTAIGLAISGFVAYFTYATGLMTALGPLMWVAVFAPLGMIMYWSFAGQKWSFESTRNFYYIFTAVMGISLSTIFAVYTAASIAQVFFITSATFASASIVGYTTKKDLSGFGGFLLMGVIGIVIAAIVNMFMQSEALTFAISIIGVLVFTGLTAYDTQRAKTTFLAGKLNADELAKFAITTALSLYLNFVNLFQMLLNLLGNKE